MREDRREAVLFIKGLLQSAVNSGRAAESKMREWWRLWPWDWFYYRHIIREGRAAQKILEEIKRKEYALPYDTFHMSRARETGPIALESSRNAVFLTSLLWLRHCS